MQESNIEEAAIRGINALEIVDRIIYTVKNNPHLYSSTDVVRMLEEL